MVVLAFGALLVAVGPESAFDLRFGVDRLLHNWLCLKLLCGDALVRLSEAFETLFLHFAVTFSCQDVKLFV